MAKKNQPQKKMSEMSYFEQQEHLKNMQKGLGEIFGEQKAQQRYKVKPKPKRHPVSMGIGVVAAGIIMAIANSSLAEGETIGAGIGIFALVVGLIVATVLAKTIKM